MFKLKIFGLTVLFFIIVLCSCKEENETKQIKNELNGVTDSIEAFINGTENKSQIERIKINEDLNETLSLFICQTQRQPSFSPEISALPININDSKVCSNIYLIFAGELDFLKRKIMLAKDKNACISIYNKRFTQYINLYPLSLKNSFSEKVFITQALAQAYLVDRNFTIDIAKLKIKNLSFQDSLPFRCVLEYSGEKAINPKSKDNKRLYFIFKSWMKTFSKGDNIQSRTNIRVLCEAYCLPQK